MGKNWWVDEIFTRIECRMDFMDRIRMLITGKFTMDVTVKCENCPGKVEGTSIFRANKIFTPKHEIGGMEIKALGGE